MPKLSASSLSYLEKTNMADLISGRDEVGYADQLLGYLLELLGQIETAKSITINDATDEHIDEGGRFAETLDDYENVEGKDLIFEDVESESHGGIKKPIKVLEVIDNRSAKEKAEGTPYALIWDHRRRCYVKRRKSILP